MAAVARGTPSFAVPPSQNTAPVNEFRCLYTHDLRKKQKKWHDGSVRFHTFNRRVMVYDDAKNYIGDLHYRVDDEFGEGVELQLDRGVLVEVGEPRGQTHTDLTGINDRGRGDKSVTVISNSSVPSRSIKRVNAADALGRPKSLAEVLGASQDRPGRARLPLKSPFENRQALEEVRNEGPPPKRQKTAIIESKRNDQPAVGIEHVVLEKENLVVHQSSTLKQRAGRQNLHVPAMISPKPVRREDVQSRSNALVSLNNATSNSGNRARHVIDLSSEDDNPNGPSRSIASTSSRKNVSDNATAHGRHEKGSVSRSSGKSKSARTKPVNINTETAELHARANKTPGSCERDTSSLSTTRTEMTSLRFSSSSKPRPKLMYKALLPASSANVRSSEHSSRLSRPTEEQNAIHVDGMPQNSQHSTRIPEVETRESIFDIGDIDEIDDSSRPATSDRVPNKPISPTIDTANQTIGEAQTLFLTQEEPHSLSSRRQSIVDDDFEIALLQAEGDEPGLRKVHDPTEPKSSIEIEDAALPDEEDGDFLEEYLRKVPRPPLATTIPHDTVASRASAQGQKEKSPTAPCLPSTNRLFRRILSEGDSPLLQSPNTSPLKPPSNVHTPALPTTTTRTSSPVRQPQEATPKSFNLQRSKSDGGVVIPRPERIETIPLPEAINHVLDPNEQGPWTTLEAFLLFDKWPESKEKNKPIFQKPAKIHHDDDDDDDNDGSDADEITANLSYRNTNFAKANLNGRFRSAKSVFRDG